MTYTVQFVRARTRALPTLAARAARYRRIALVLAAVWLLACSGATPASAGTYTISGSCSLWEPWDSGGSGTAVYAECPVLIARNLGGAFSAPPGGGAGWIFRAPPGTAIVDYRLSGLMYGYSGWQAALFTEPDNRVYENCPGSSCPGATKFLYDAGYPAPGSATIVARLRCGAASGCPNNEGQVGNFRINASSITLSDGSAPSVVLTGGTLLGGGWKSGSLTLVVDASDNVGIQEARVLVDGVRRERTPRACNFGQKVPCSNGATTLNVPTAGLAEGAHSVTGEAVDASGNVGGSATATVYVDNNAPTQPLEVALAGAAGFRSVNAFEVSWRNPPQSFAPIAGAAYELCPSVPADASKEAKAKAQAACVKGFRNGTNLTAIKDLKLPGPGLWDLKLWLVDAAGNQQPASAVQINGLGYDDTPPADVAFQAPDPQDPARVHVQASDAVSGLAAGAIEVRRDGQDAWQPLPTEVTAGGVAAVVDDETLPKGVYFLRARVTNAAGLETSTDRSADGQPAAVKLPIRLASHLRAGKRGQRRCHGHGRHRSCRYRLATKPKLRVGRTTRLYGRLTVAGQAMPSTALEVWRRLDLDGAGWARTGTVTTSRTGRFSYRARRGPARTIRFRYAGTSMIRGRNSEVALRVRASTTFRPSRRTAVNGEYVTFRGRLKGGWIPPAGALVELQVRARKQWRTFATPRTDAKGRWAYRYRFETVARGRATYRFRARVRRQPGLPFTTGASRPVRVRVRGL